LRNHNKAHHKDAEDSALSAMFVPVAWDVTMSLAYLRWQWDFRLWSLALWYHCDESGFFRNICESAALHIAITQQTTIKEQYSPYPILFAVTLHNISVMCTMFLPPKVRL
jgi:hypothetical protein